MSSNSDMKLNLTLKAFDGMSNVVKNACSIAESEFDKMQKKLENVSKKFDAIGKNMAVFGGAVTAAAGLNVKAAGDFEQGMNNVSTLIDTNTESLSAMSKEVLKIGKDSPKALSDLTDGLYSIRSAGISAADQFNVLKGSEKLAVSGLATTAEAVDIATSAINAFGLKGQETEKIYDMFFKVVKYGKTNVSEFAQGFGSVAGVVAAAGIQLDEYSASVAAMTTSGVKASIAHTQLKAAIAGLSRGSKEQVQVFNKLGAKSFNDLVKKSGGMVNAFNSINKAVNGNQSELIKLVGSVEAYNAILSLTGANNKVYRQTLDDMRNGGDSINEAYAKQMGGLNNQINALKNNLQALGIKFGTALLPAVKAAGAGIKAFTNILDKIPDNLNSFLAVGTTAIGVVSLLTGTVLMAVPKIVTAFNAVKAGYEAVNLIMWANPAIAPILGVAAVIAAVGTAAVFCYKKFEGFRSVCDGVFAVIKACGAGLAVLAQNFWTSALAVGGFALKIWDAISPAVKFGAVILSWTTPIGLVIRGVMTLCKWIGSLIEKAGGFRGIGEKLQNWGNKKAEKAQAINAETKRNRNYDGSHAQGLDYVPYDGYIAQTHKGEAILTAHDAQLWRNGNTSNDNSQQTISVKFNMPVTIQNATPEAKEEFITQLRKYKDEIVQIIENVQNRKLARAY